MTNALLSRPLLLVFPGHETLADSLQAHFECDRALVDLHRFPDGETKVTLPDGLRWRQVILLCSLDQPDTRLAPLLFAACAARELGAASVGLIAPYLAYMRQDTRFHPGEAISARTFAIVLSQHLDFLMTVDPHLHRYASLNEIYPIPAEVVPAADAMVVWIARAVQQPVLIGPDSESEQWVASVAAKLGAPYTTLSKTRHGDHDVEVTLPDASRWAGYTPVLLDDIISTGRTLIAAAGRLQQLGLPAPVCVAVHAVFAGDAFAAMQAAGIERIVTCNTIRHASNQIDVMPNMASALKHLLLQDLPNERFLGLGS